MASPSLWRPLAVWDCLVWGTHLNVNETLAMTVLFSGYQLLPWVTGSICWEELQIFIQMMTKKDQIRFWLTNIGPSKILNCETSKIRQRSINLFSYVDSCACSWPYSLRKINQKTKPDVMAHICELYVFAQLSSTTTVQFWSHSNPLIVSHN